MIAVTNEYSRETHACYERCYKRLKQRNTRLLWTLLQTLKAEKHTPVMNAVINA